MRKTSFACLLVACITLAFPNISQAKEEFVRIGTAGVGGGFYLIGNTMAQLGTQVKNGINYSAITGGATKNIMNLDAKKIELGLAQTPVVSQALEGTGPFKKGKIQSLRFVTAVYNMPFHILVNKNSGITKISDFKGKKIDIGPVGTGIEANTRTLFEIYNLNWADMKLDRVNRNEIQEQIESGVIEGTVFATNIPTAWVSESLRSGKVNLLPMDDKERDALTEKYKCYSKAVIPAGSYPGYDKDIKVVASICVLLTHKDVDDETIYKTTKMLYDNAKFLKERSHYFSTFSPDNAFEGMTVPLHPGAEKYYREIGIIK